MNSSKMICIAATAGINCVNALKFQPGTEGRVTTGRVAKALTAAAVVSYGLSQALGPTVDPEPKGVSSVIPAAKGPYPEPLQLERFEGVAIHGTRKEIEGTRAGQLKRFEDEMLKDEIETHKKKAPKVALLLHNNDEKAATKWLAELETKSNTFEKVSFLRGENYCGGFSADGKRSGYGVYNWTDGTTYEGAWDGNVKSGLGVYTYENGYQYIGSWSGNIKHGPGKYINADGKILRVGYWEKNKLVDWTNFAKFEQFLSKHVCAERTIYSDFRLTYDPAVQDVPFFYSKTIGPIRDLPWTGCRGLAGLSWGELAAIGAIKLDDYDAWRSEYGSYPTREGLVIDTDEREDLEVQRVFKEAHQSIANPRMYLNPRTDLWNAVSLKKHGRMEGRRSKGEAENPQATSKYIESVVKGILDTRSEPVIHRILITFNVYNGDGKNWGEHEFCIVNFGKADSSDSSTPTLMLFDAYSDRYDLLNRRPITPDDVRCLFGLEGSKTYADLFPNLNSHVHRLAGPEAFDEVTLWPQRCAARKLDMEKVDQFLSGAQSLGAFRARKEDLARRDDPAVKLSEFTRRDVIKCRIMLEAMEGDEAKAADLLLKSQ